MHPRRLKGHKGDLYSSASEVHQWALGELRDLLLKIGFKVRVLGPTDRTLHAYPEAIHQHPLLLPDFVCDERRYDEEPDEWLEIVVRSTGSPRPHDERLRLILPDERCFYVPLASKAGDYRHHGSVLLPLTFHGSRIAGSLDFAALRAPLRRVYNALAGGQSDQPPRESPALTPVDMRPAGQAPLPDARPFVQRSSISQS